MKFRYAIITITSTTYLINKYSLSLSFNSISSWFHSPSLFLFWKMDLTQNLLFFAQFILGSLMIKQKIIHHHLKFFPIHFVAIASENLHNYTTILQYEHLQVICTIIQNMLIIVAVVILRFCCNCYFKMKLRAKLKEAL